MACSCNASLGNTGRVNCINLPNVAYKLIITPTFDSTGAKNYIDTTVTLDSTWSTDYLNAGRSGATNTDIDQRWFPVGALKNVESVRSESLTESFNDGDIAFIQEGVRTFTGMIIDRPSPEYLGKLKSFRCTQLSAYIVDVDGNIFGNGATADKLYPFRLNSETWDIQYVMPTDTTVTKLMVNFSFAKDENDEDIKMILASETTDDMRDLEGLVDVNAGAASSISTTGFTTALTYDYGSQVSAQDVKGLVLADFDLYNETQTSSITISSVTESPDGTYAFVFPAATSADVLSLNLQKDGFEMTELSITIP